MNIGFWLCGVLVIQFVIIGVLFALFKEKTAKFVSGFNSLPKEEQEQKKNSKWFTTVQYVEVI